MTKLSTKELNTALAQQYIRLGIGNPWGEQNEEMNIAREIMKKYKISIEDIQKTCGMSDVQDYLTELEKTENLQGHEFLTSINNVIYIADYDMNLKSGGHTFYENE